MSSGPAGASIPTGASGVPSASSKLLFIFYSKLYHPVLIQPATFFFLSPLSSSPCSSSPDANAVCPRGFRRSLVCLCKTSVSGRKIPKRGPWCCHKSGRLQVPMWQKERGRTCAVAKANLFSLWCMESDHRCHGKLHYSNLHSQRCSLFSSLLHR